ncbi:hypothetical protein NE865_00107 [Phthorimaea operculella]|nr:hypothetical protein NE865_00107 [Phthorimaea operculella]
MSEPQDQEPPKASKRKSESLEDGLARLVKKVKKLEKQIRARNNGSTQANAPADQVPPDQGQEENQPDEPGSPEQDESAPPDEPAASTSGDHCSESEPPDEDVVEDEEPVSGDLPQPLSSESPSNQTSSDQPNNLPLSEAVAKDKEDKPTDEPMELDQDVLAILGEDPSSTVKYGPEIRKELASRLQHIATEGLSKEIRKELINKYLLPANCLHVGAPTINPELKAALNEAVVKRDKGIETKQKEMASAISCVSDVITYHLNCKEKNNQILQKLMDVGRILCDIQHGDSVTRRNFVLFSVKSDMQEHLKNTKIDTSLFGEQLSETLKSAKAVNKSGAELKIDSSKNNPKKAKPPVPQNLNRKAAPPRRQAGAAVQAPRNHAPAPPAPRAQPQQPQHPAPAYRMSSTQPPPPPRRRY